MRRALALVLAVAAVLAASCGNSKPAATAAEVAPSNTYLLIEGRPLRENSKREFAWSAELAASCGFNAAQPPGLLELEVTESAVILV